MASTAEVAMMVSTVQLIVEARVGVFVEASSQRRWRGLKAGSDMVMMATRFFLAMPMASLSTSAFATATTAAMPPAAAATKIASRQIGPPPPQTGPWLSQPFVAGVGGYAEYRIPALVQLPSGDLLAFCEGRKYSSADMDWNDIVMRRSSNGGRSWEPQQLIHSESSSRHHVTIGNPSPVVVTSKPGRVVLTGTRQTREGFRVISDTDGRTWGPAVYEPALVAPHERGSGVPPPAYGQRAGNWSFYMPGPAAGVQLPSGRLLVGAYHGIQYNKSKTGGEAFSFVIYSDTLGENWSWVGGHAYDVGPGAGECQVAPAPNGSLIMRTRTGRHFPPAFSWSLDPEGTSWTKPTYWTNDMMHADVYQHYNYTFTNRTSGKEETMLEFGPFPGSNTQGSIARLPGSDLLVTSTPFGGGPGRQNMTIFVSVDSGASWRIDQHVYSGYSGYSALVGLNATHYGLLWEVSGVPPAGNPPGSGDPFHISYTVLRATASTAEAPAPASAPAPAPLEGSGGGGACKSDADCSILGVCQLDSCTGCRDGWTGPHCEVIDVLPAPANAGLRIAGSASWGAGVANVGGAWHMLSCFSTLHCDILSYQTNTIFLHATSADDVAGPYVPTAAPLPDQSYAPGVNGTFAPRPKPAWDSDNMISPQLLEVPPPWAAAGVAGADKGFILVYESGSKFMHNRWNCTATAKPPGYPSFSKAQKRIGLAFSSEGPRGPFQRMADPLLHLDGESDQRNPV
eukprot:SAG11_NODE_850_length_6868_cov_3.543523_2_plen_737_part_00